jgi:hypothetical protein
VVIKNISILIKSGNGTKAGEVEQWLSKDLDVPEE